ncbi:hypothetical protein [Clostridium sp.]|uniref:hypothetical protein n=1 Tax=Clostridium sp. TaxID=1506 RepID=UPI001A60E4E8|nr:hypothetical protein [Clostridium sp.]MBK5236051.1 hypothetical protein [Clostridium sp.]
MSITIQSAIDKLRIAVWYQVSNEKNIDLAQAPGANIIKMAIAKYIDNINPNDIIALLNLNKYITQVGPDEASIEDDDAFNESLKRLIDRY